MANLPAERALNERQIAYVQALVHNGGNRRQAAKTAGYADWEHESTRLARNPAVQRAIFLETQARLQDLAPLAINTLKNILMDDSAPHGAKATAAKEVLDRAGHTSKLHEKQGDNRKSLEDMSPDELEDFIRKGQSIVEAEKRKGPGIVDITPNNAQSTDADDI